MRNRILPPVTSFFADEDGKAFYEYVLVASLTVVVGIIVLLALGKSR
jgi:Flp pilus assembly pilin Flp